MPRILLPDRSHVFRTGETDPICRHYQPFVRYFMDKRLEMALRLLGTRRFRRLLDAGYGGGIFLPELSRRTDELHGVDLHAYAAEVERMAQAEGLTVSLRHANLSDTGYPDRYFDCVVCMSVLEFVEDLPQAMTELVRITEPRGMIVLGFPGENFATRLGYLLARTPDPLIVHRSNYRAILTEANRLLGLRRLLRFPSFFPPRFALFFVGEFQKP